MCDMAVAGTGSTMTPMEITVTNGESQDAYSPDAKVSMGISESLNTDKWSNVVGEFAFGIKLQSKTS